MDEKIGPDSVISFFTKFFEKLKQIDNDAQKPSLISTKKYIQGNKFSSAFLSVDNDHVREFQGSKPTRVAVARNELHACCVCESCARDRPMDPFEINPNRGGGGWRSKGGGASSDGAAPTHRNPYTS